MSRARNTENKGLPARWRFTHGAYYCQVPLGCEAAQVSDCFQSAHNDPGRHTEAAMGVLRPTCLDFGFRLVHSLSAHELEAHTV
jgi:hypothetical protein